jgi:alpha-tubulin suppressor-like RCC1 family protein
MVNYAPNVTALASGAHHGVALVDDGTVWTWGFNDFGALGQGTGFQRINPVQVTGLQKLCAACDAPLSISSGGRHTVVLTRDGTVWGAGANYHGQLGEGFTTDDRVTPVQAQGIANVTAITAGFDFTLALRHDGTVWGWGSNIQGQVAGSDSMMHVSPRQVQGLSGITALSSGDGHTLALKSDGTVWTWGSNTDGQLGVDPASTPYRSTPAQVQGLSGVIALSAGADHSVALKGDGTVWTWGFNRNGGLGDGTTTDRFTPAQVQGLSDIIAISGGGYHTVALHRDGTPWAWGWNHHGQLGDGTTVDQPTPVRLQGFSGVTAIAAGMVHTLALRVDRTVWAWGNNTAGQLGVGTAVPRTVTPTQVTEFPGVTAISANSLQSVALRDDGTVWTWGYNDFGQLGDGTRTWRASPGAMQGPRDLCATTPARRGLTWVQTTPDTSATCAEPQPRVVCNDCDPYAGDTLCTELRPLLCIQKDAALTNCGVPATFTDGWAAGTVKLTSFLVRGTQLTSLAAANALCANTFGAGYRMAEHHDGDGGWGWRAKGSIPLVSTAASTHPRDGRANAPNRVWVHIRNQPGNCWD